METKKCLNVGCGSKFHPSWTNLDMVSFSPYVQAHNILEGLPFPENYFDVVYHSQVIEHIPKDKSYGFIKECFRVLKPGGVLRVVCPDLENIAKEYLRNLNEAIQNPTKNAIANYDWIMLEMYDQTVRNEPGGQMAKVLEQPILPNEDYIVGRIGRVARSIIESSRQKTANPGADGLFQKIRRATVKEMLYLGARRLKQLLSTKAMRVGSFRLGGEIHLWMYDRFSLSRLLSQAGFKDIENLSAHESSIPNWNGYQLDVRDNVVIDPTCLFMEAKKPIPETANGRKF